MKVLSVIGTRPEAIKMAPILEALERHDGVVSRLVVSAQHRELADDVLTLFGLRADHDLDLMTGNQTPSQVAAAVIARLEPVLAAERPDWVLVQGDTTTVMAAAIAASYAHTRGAPVEARLRTGDPLRPSPEEPNRRAV